jgi:hypothetical protein
VEFKPADPQRRAEYQRQREEAREKTLGIVSGLAAAAEAWRNPQQPSKDEASDALVFGIAAQSVGISEEARQHVQAVIGANQPEEEEKALELEPLPSVNELLNFDYDTYMVDPDEEGENE